jgi:rare lipoprotein A|tara:strand:- start:184 stop:915 length:732 start_codon:yes stop_codon:yes gene_type:complete
MYTSKNLIQFFLGCLFLVGCQSANNETVATLSKPLGIEFKENDVEAPEIFNAEGLAYWDGQSSLGGVWITHPNVNQATRVLIKDKYGGKSVIGAIFNRIGEGEEKRMLLSSEAAASLGLDANENRIMTVTALRALKTVKTIKNNSKMKSSEMDILSLQNSGNKNIALSKPYIQVGIFSIEQNARNTAEVMHQLNIQPTVKEQTSRNKTFWRVIVGPAVDMNERSTLLQKVKAVGFGDAYAVSK